MIDLKCSRNWWKKMPSQTRLDGWTASSKNNKSSEMPALSDAAIGTCFLLSLPCALSLPRDGLLQMPKESCPNHPLLSGHSLFLALLSSSSALMPFSDPVFPIHMPQFPRFPGDMRK
jgi:hypothetical protein